MTDESIQVRKNAFEKVLAAREAAYKNVILKNLLPVINFAARTYYKMIDWFNLQYVSPAVLKNITNRELIDKLTNNQVYKNGDYCKYPCHTVAVERTVKLVTEASKRVCGKDNRNSFIQVTLLSRKNY